MRSDPLTLEEARTALNAGGDFPGVLERVWYRLKGGDAHAMAGFKLPNRIANAMWRDPVATFTIERHGDLDGEVQTWKVDLARGNATCVAERSLRPPTPQLPWDERGVAAEIASLIRAGRDDPRLSWQDARRHAVKVIVSKALPPGSGLATPSQATRLRVAIAKLGDAWVREASWWAEYACEGRNARLGRCHHARTA